MKNLQKQIEDFIQNNLFYCPYLKAKITTKTCEKMQLRPSPLEKGAIPVYDWMQLRPNECGKDCKIYRSKKKCNC